jgi:hypothetical protein
LSEQEVIQINYIIKKRALRHVAAAEKEWLCPEGRLETTHWGKFGKGLLLMPEPRDIHMGGQIAIGYKGPCRALQRIWSQAMAARFCGQGSRGG